MKAFKSIHFLYIVISLILIGCATVPTFRVPQPWIRSLKSNQTPQTGARLKVEVSGTTSPLLGNEQLTAGKIREQLSFLLIRRGFTVNNDSPDYIVRLCYKTDRSDNFRFSSDIASSYTISFATTTVSGAEATSGLGVSIARAVNALTTWSNAVGQETAGQLVFYTHTIAIEILNQDSSVAWKGEATWDSDELNLINRILPVIQLLLSDLPSDRRHRPEIPEVKTSHVENYYKLECQGRWFTCPALPYRILFEETVKWFQVGIVQSAIKNPNAMAAYLDLIQTAEFALPSGDEDNWRNPIQASLWKKVTLGSQYLIGPDRKPINVLINLTGKKEGYIIEKCWVANDDEYASFQQRMQKWQQALADYYDVFLH